MSTPDTLTISRASIAEVLRIVDVVEAGIGGLPHRVAVPLIQETTDLRDIVGECLPGGYVGRCEGCGQPIGAHDVGASDTEDGGEFCTDCVARWNRPVAEQAADKPEKVDADADAQAAVEVGAAVKRADEIWLSPEAFQLIKQLNRGAVRSTHSATKTAAFELEREGVARQVAPFEWEITRLGTDYLWYRGFK